MTTHPDPHENTISAPSGTENVVRDYVRSAASRLAEVLKDSAIEWDTETRWIREADGHVRPRKVHTRIVRQLTEEWFSALPDYQACIDQLRADAVIGTQLDRLIGTRMSALCIEANHLLHLLFLTMLDDQGNVSFSDERFNAKWCELDSFFRAGEIAFKMIAPLPHLVVPTFPLRLNDTLEIDRLTDNEMTRCCREGVLRPVSSRFPYIQDQIAIGIRRTTPLPKLIMDEEAPQQQSGKPDDEGSFGARPLDRADLVIDDVLTAIRLFKQTWIRAAGYISWTDALWLDAGMSFRVSRQWPYGGPFTLSDDEMPSFLELWRLLERGAARYAFSIRRFNLAFDRELPVDRIVDLVIAAEGLFLGDMDDKYRGEIRFRFALRAAQFIDHPGYGKRDVFQIMRRAYDARSAVVHTGASPSDTQLPGDKGASLSSFIDVVEDLVRRALRKTLTMKEDAKKLRSSEYWDGLLFPPDQAI
jgi:hypothetical protein